MSDSGEVENRYRSALGHALPAARAEVGRVAEAFAVTRRAMAEGAWVSPAADEFAGACASVEASAVGWANDCVWVLQWRHSVEPVTVLPFDRRARWV